MHPNVGSLSIKSIYQTMKYPVNKFCGFRIKTLKKSIYTYSSIINCLLLIALAGCGFGDEKAVVVTKAILHPIEETNRSRADATNEATVLFQASGWIEPDPYPRRVPSLYDGIVNEVFVLEGDTVKKGQKLVSLVNDDARLALKFAQAQLDEANFKEAELFSEIKLSKSSLKKANNILNQHKAIQEEQIDYFNRLESLPIGAVPSVDLHKARKKADSLKFSTQGAAANVEESEGRIELLSNQLNSLRSITESRKILWEKAELDFNRTQILSPINGVILRLVASPGKRLMRQMDAPDSSTALIIFEADKLQARIDVPLADASKLSLGQKVEIVCSILPELKFEGILTRISGEADLQRNTLQVKVRIPNPDERLRPEMLCRAKFLLNTENSKSKNSANSLGVFVPFTLKPENNQSIKELWIIGADGRSAELRKVRFGKEINNQYISVISGLNAGDLIILNPPSSLKSGDRIKISKIQ